MPAVNAAFSQMAPITGALVGRKSKGLLGATTVPSLVVKEDTDVEASTVLQSQLMDFIAVARVGCVMDVRNDV